MQTKFSGVISTLFAAGLSLALGLQSDWVTTESGLKFTRLQAGTGAMVKPGQQISIHETVTFEDGRLFFTTRKGPPLKINLGANQLIQGLEEGLLGMQVGEIRKLVVPPHLSKRSAYPNGLSPEDVLIYEVELMEIHSKSP